MAKSELVPVGNVGDVEGLARILSCRVASLQMKYLGLSLGASSRLILFGSAFHKPPALDRHLHPSFPPISQTSLPISVVFVFDPLVVVRGGASR